MTAERKTAWVDGMQSGVSLIGAVLTLVNTIRTLWETVAKPTYCSPPFVHYGWAGLSLLLLSSALWYALPSMKDRRQRSLTIWSIRVGLLLVVVGLIVVFGLPWWQQHQMQSAYPFYIQVAQFREMGIDAQLSLKLQDLLDEELHRPDFDLRTASVGKRCEVFGPGDREKAEQARAGADAAILFYGWIDSEGGECHLTMDRARLPSLPVDTALLFKQLGVELPERVDPALAFVVAYRDIHQTESDTKVKSHVIGTIKECCALFGSGLAYHMEQDRLGQAYFFDFDRQERAIALFQDALDRRCPSASLILLFQGNGYAVLERLDKAEKAWKKVVDGGLENVQARINLAALAVARGDWAIALAWLKPVTTQLNVENLPARYLLASAYAMNGYYGESMAMWQSVLTIEPDDLIARRSANLMRDLVDLERTQSREWIEQNILQALAYRNLGIGLVSIDRPEQAEIVLETALTSTYAGVESYQPWDLERDLYWWLGITYGNQGRLDKWQEQWALIGRSPADILRLPEQQRFYWRYLLGPQSYRNLEDKFGPEAEMLPEPEERLLEAFYWYELQNPVILPVPRLY